MGSSRSITFQPTRPLAGWGLAVYDGWLDGERRFTVLLEARLADGTIRSGIFAYRPTTPGYEVMKTAADGHGVEPMHMAAEYLVEGTREALARRSDISAAQRAHWQPVVEAYAAAVARHADRYPDGVPAFEVIGANFVSA